MIFLCRNLKCKSTVLFDEGWSKQSVALKEITERLKLPVHPQLQKIATEQIEVGNSAVLTHDAIICASQFRSRRVPRLHMTFVITSKLGVLVGV